MIRRVALAIAAVAAIVATTSRADAEPSDRDLVLVGLALAPPTYLVGVTLHEGSHALAAKLVGAEVVDMRLFPPGREPRTGKFRFGWTYVRGLEGTGERLWFYAAPKLTDVALLGGFAALVLTDAWPRNRYGQLALTVFATGLWVDFSKDLLAFSRHNDVVKVFDLWCMTGWRQLPARVIYAGVVVGLGAIVARGYQRTFERPVAQQSTLMLPIVTSTF
ncbi:MAG: M50 family metallopeptidase [Kofleriaceae bacterium]